MENYRITADQQLVVDASSEAGNRRKMFYEGISMNQKAICTQMRSVPCGRGELAYQLTRKSVKNVNLRIKPDGRILVSANRRVSVAFIDDFVRRNQDYIYRALERFAQAREKRLEEASAEHSADLRQYADGEGMLVDDWLKHLREETFAQICREIYPVFAAYGIRYPQIKIRRMTSRWGSCQPARGIITLNSRLIEAPRESIEYVVLHEFAHFIHPNHSKAFYALVESLMPDWKERKGKLP